MPTNMTRDLFTLSHSPQFFRFVHCSCSCCCYYSCHPFNFVIFCFLSWLSPPHNLSLYFLALPPFHTHFFSTASSICIYIERRRSVTTPRLNKLNSGNFVNFTSISHPRQLWESFITCFSTSLVKAYTHTLYFVKWACLLCHTKQPRHAELNFIIIVHCMRANEWVNHEMWYSSGVDC
jgi:hypothetical protein